MATVPSQQTFTAGATLTAAQLNDDVRDAVNWFLTNRPKCKAYASAATSSTTGISNWTNAAFAAESFDNDSIHSTVTNNSRLTCQTAGLYRVTGSMAYDANATGARSARILKNGTDVLDLSRYMAAPTSNTALDVHGYYQFIVGDYIQLQGAQNSGSTIDMMAGEFVTWLAMEWIGT